MKRIVLFFCLFYGLWSMSAQNNSDHIQVLDTLQLNAYGYQNTPARIPKTIQIIKINKLTAAPVESLDALLELVAGIDVRSRGSKGVQSDLSIRGGNFDQVLVLLNGVPINNPQTGHHNLDLPVDFNMLDHIEILEGASGDNIGVNAFSGAINLVTKSPHRKQAKAILKAGQFGYVKGVFDLSHQLKNIAVYNGFSFQRSNGYLVNDSINNTDFYSLKDFVNIHYNGVKFPLDLQAGYHQKDFGANSFYTAKYPWQYEKTEGYFAALSSQFGKKFILKPVVYYRLNFDQFQLFRESVYRYEKPYFIYHKDTAQYAPGIYYPGHNYHKTRQLGGELHLSFHSKYGYTFGHVAWQNQKIWSNKLGENLSQPIVVNDRISYTKYAGRSYFETSLNQQKKWHNWIFGAGINTLFDEKYGWQVTGGGFVNHKWSHLMQYISISSASRLPTFTDLYYQGPSNIGNPDLKPEKSWTYEFGSKYWYKNSQINASIFYRQANQTIDWVKFNINDKWQPQNLTKLQTLGLEFSFRQVFQHKFFKEFALSYAYLQMNKDNTSDFISKYALDYLKHKLTFQFSHRFIFQTNLFWTGIYKNRNGQYLTYENDAYRLYDFKPYFLTNLKWSKQAKKFRVGLSVENLFNITYRDLSYIKMPGRWLIFELQYQIK